MKKITDDMHILCENKQEYYKLMEILEAKGYKWNSGHLPTKLDVTADRYCSMRYGIGIKTHSDKTLTYGISSTILDECTIKFKEIVEDNKMTKSDLKDGMIVKIRNGNAYIYFSRWGRFIREEGWLSIDEYTDDLCEKNGTGNYDIMAIYDCILNSLDNIKDVITYKIPIWEREEPVEMTIAEVEEKLGIKNLKIVKEKEDE